jgi:hypothetical protein
MPRTGTRLSALSVVSAAFVTASLAVSAVSSPAAAATSSGWTQYPAPITGSASLFSVSTVSPTDAWIGGGTYTDGKIAKGHGRLGLPPTLHELRATGTSVGPADTSTCGETESHSVILHWNGSTWASVAVPDVGGVRDVHLSSATDGWATGECESLHWNGSAWTAVRYAPLPVAGTFTVNGFSSDGPADAWMLDSALQTTGEVTYVEHWDGSRWRLLSLPGVGSGTLLTAVSSRSPNDVWIAGQDANSKPFFLHWDGTSWTRIAAPSTGHPGGTVIALQPLASDDVWAVGDGLDAGAGTFFPLVMHWDGTGWTNTPPAAPVNGVMFTLADDGGKLWAGGNTQTPANPDYQMAMLRWNGTKWVAAPAPVAGEGTVNSLSSIPGGGMWGVGYVDDSTGNPTPVVVMHP